jgi:hypothetical protein
MKTKIYRIMMLAAAFYGCKNWPVILRAQRWQSVFRNEVLRKIFGTYSAEVTQYWRRLHSEELHNLYPHQILFE